MSKIDITIVYSPQTDQPHVCFENERGRITRSNHKIIDTYNISMGFYSNQEPQLDDSILVIEPYCVLQRDYEIDFVSRFDKIFTWATKAFENSSVAHKVIQINHPSIQPANADQIKQNWLPWNEKTDEVIFVANNKSSPHSSQLYSLRLEIAELLVLRGYKVSFYGQIPIPKSYYKGTIPDGGKTDVLKKAKFSMCSENSYDPIFSHNYLSEKLPEVLLAGTVPLYMGCYNIDDLNIPKNYIDLRPFIKKEQNSIAWIGDINPLLDHILNYKEEEYNKMLINIENNLKDPFGLNHIVSWNRVYETMINTFYSENQPDNTLAT